MQSEFELRHKNLISNDENPTSSDNVSDLSLLACVKKKSLTIKAVFMAHIWTLGAAVCSSESIFFYDLCTVCREGEGAPLCRYLTVNRSGICSGLRWRHSSSSGSRRQTELMSNKELLRCRDVLLNETTAVRTPKCQFFSPRRGNKTEKESLRQWQHRCGLL